MSCTDLDHICSLCLEHRTGCTLCGPNGAVIIRTPHHILEKYKEEAAKYKYRHQ